MNAMPRTLKSPDHAEKISAIKGATQDVSGNPAIISHRAGARLQQGSVWVYESDIEKLPKNLAPGALVPVLDRRGFLYGTALYSASSQIALRLFARDAEITRPQFLFLAADRLRAAIARRASLFSAETNAARLVFSEADELPGLIVDRYADLVIVQLLTQGTAADDFRETVTNVLVSCLAFSEDNAPDDNPFAATPLTAIVERPDPRIRELEQIPAPSSEPLYLANAITRGEHAHRPHAELASEPNPEPAAPLATVFSLNGLRFHFDANSGQKTGAFLDQRENYAAAARHAAAAAGDKSALDVCTYQGGFALHLAQVCPRVTGVDASRAALEVAERNLQLNQDKLDAALAAAYPGENGRLESQVDWLEADAFALLRDYASAGHRYSTIVLDPPAFAKSKRAAESALRGYKEMNLRALQMISPGGILVTCSCSHHVSLADFTAAVASAAADAGRRVSLLETRSAAVDHPVILTLPETYYLKCLIARVD
jgi:23S rRNA (cytosine1962-C5)-methyltransferase